MNDSSRRRVRLARRLSWLAVGALTVAALVPVPAFALNGDAPAPNAEQRLFVDGNPVCEGNPFYSFKVTPPTEEEPNPADPLANGPVGPNGEVIISNLTTYSFDWALSDGAEFLFDVAAVIVKAGSGAYVYFYEDTGDDSDTTSSRRQTTWEVLRRPSVTWSSASTRRG